MADYVGIDERGKARIDLYLTGLGETRILKGLVVTTNLFEVLGVAPLLGRGFAGKDDALAILSYDCWQREFAGDPNVIGRSITLSGVRRDLIGVLPQGVVFPNKEVQVYMPPGEFTPDRIFHDAGVVARLRAGISLQQARSEMAVIGARLQKAYPKANATLDPHVEAYHSALSATSRPALIMLFSAVGILFLIVCSNIAISSLAAPLHGSRSSPFARRSARPMAAWCASYSRRTCCSPYSAVFSGSSWPA